MDATKRVVKSAVMLLPFLLSFVLSACSAPAVHETRHIYFLVGNITPVEHLVELFEASHPDIEVHTFYGPADDDWPRHYNAALLPMKPGKTELLQDLTPFLETDKTFDVEDIFPGLMAASHDRDRLVVLPLGWDFTVLLFDSNQFAAAGVPLPSANWTWDDWMNAAVQIDRYKKRSHKGSALGPGGGSLLLSNWLAEHVHPYREVDGKYVPDYDAPSVTDFIDRTRKSGLLSLFLVRSDVLDSASYSSTPLSDLVDGNVAMSEVTYGQLSRLLPLMKYHPEIKLVALPQPVVRFSHGNWGGYEFIGPMVAMSRGSQEQQAVWEWLAFLSKHYLFAHGFLPARRSLLNESRPFEEIGSPLQSAALRQVLTSITASQGSGKAGRDTGALTIIYRHFTDLLFSSSADEVKQAKQGVATELADWYKQGEEAKVSFTITPPVSASDLKKRQLRVFDMNLYGSGAKSLTKLFQKSHPQWHVSFWPASSSADAVAVSVSDDTVYEPPGLFPAPLLPVQNITAISSLQRADFLPQAFDVSWRQQTPGIPVALRPLLLYYDAKAFARLGIAPPKDGSTVGDVLSTAGEIARKDPALLAYAPADGYETAFILRQQGVSLFSANLTPQFTNATVLQAIERLRHLAGKRDFLQGTTPSELMFPRPHHFVPHSYVPVALMPRPGTRWPLSVSFCGVNKNAEHPDMAWQWAAFVAHHPEMEGDALPALKSLAASDATRTRLGPARYDAYMTMLKRIPAEPITDRDILECAALWWFDRALRQVGPETDLRDVLEAAQAKALAFLTCTGGQVKDMAQLAACARKVDPEHPLAQTAP